VTPTHCTRCFPFRQQTKTSPSSEQGEAKQTKAPRWIAALAFS
jgi:hypothetical protein